ncbi:MAG: DEAD/DEAH box helicase [Thermomicrobiales bacterium]
MMSQPDTATAPQKLAASPAPASDRIDADIAQFEAFYPFALDGFQREAIGALLHGDSVMVAAPTGTGKTVVAEFGVWDAFKRTGRVIYTTPIKALSNQKYRDLRAVYGDEVGLLTGDVSENRDARVVVMTTEVLRNMLLQTPWDLDNVDTVIFDEIHYLADPERGTTWEEAIILCPDHVQLICLSATINNAAEIADWISRTHRPIRLISHFDRAVPLALHYFHDGKLNLVVNHKGERVQDFPHTGGELRKQSARQGHGRRKSERSTPEMDEPQPREIVDALAARDMLPAIYFLFSRNDCQAYAERLAVMRPNLVTPRQADLIEQTINAVLAGMRDEDRELEQVQTITALARKGIGFHHAGLLPILKQLVEILFGRGLMEVVFATDTLALGVNMPARTVVIGRMSKWDGRRRRMLIPNEFQQMAGRAGRRGMDPFGHVVVPYSPWFTFRETLDIATGELHPVRSAFAIRYNTVLNLWDPPAGERVRALLQESLGQFQSSQRIRDLEDDIIAIIEEIDRIPQGCLIGLEAGDELLEDYRRLNRSLSAAQNKEQRLAAEQTSVLRDVDTSVPWSEPGRQALRRALRGARPGAVAHVRDGGWTLMLGKGKQGGVGRFLFRDGSIRLLTEYRQIDHLTDKRVTLPAELVEPGDGITEASELADAETLAALWDAVAVLDLPDLDAMAAAHRAVESERTASRVAVLATDYDDAKALTHALWEERQAHPCHACDRRDEHRDYLVQVDKLEKERRELEAALGREVDQEEERLRNVIRGIRNVLHRFGYLHRGYPTEKADMLADVFDNDGLILCELVDRGILDHLPPEDLAEVFSWFSFDREFRYGNRFILPDRLVLARRRIEDVEHAVLSEERGEGLSISEGHNPNFYGAARAWCRGATMAEIGEKIELSEGDLVMTFNKTIDLMRQVADMLKAIDAEHPLRVRLRQAERLLKRDIVEHSLALGFAPIELPEIARAELEAARAEAPPPRKPRARKAKAEAPVASASGTDAADVVVEAEPAEAPPPRKSRARKPNAKAEAEAAEAPDAVAPPDAPTPAAKAPRKRAPSKASAADSGADAPPSTTPRKRAPRKAATPSSS